MAESQVPGISISSITFSDGTNVQVSPDDVVLVVGPNNAGKSECLRALRQKLENAGNVSPVLEGFRLQKTGSQDELSSWIESWAVRRIDSSAADPIYHAHGHATYLTTARNEWQLYDNAVGGLARWFCNFLSADERLQICNPADNISLGRDDPYHPIHFLQRDDQLEIRLSSKFRKAFGADLIVHRNAGNIVPLHVGDRPEPAADEDRVSAAYIRRLEKLPTLHTQGDGMRSFAGVLLATSVGRESIMLIDEPEAFLHPPQARLLGTTLVQDRNKKCQLFIATHSTDVLRGVLDTESPDVRVIRIQRSGTINTVRLLSNERIKELWGDPLLRYSNILDGLFHDGVVVCEADADCRFYSAMLDATLDATPDDAKRPDLMFTHCGGKARLATVIRALREVDVPVQTVADFDTLSEEEPLKSIIESLGIEWRAVRADWQLVKSAIDSKKPELNTDEVRKEIEKLLSSVATLIFPSKTKSEIQKVLRRSSPWAQAKLVGKAFVPSGDPSKACERLLSKLRAGGLHIVEVGELEGYARTEGGHGPKWVNAVLARDLATDPELENARKFVMGLAGEQA